VNFVLEIGATFFGASATVDRVFCIFELLTCGLYLIWGLKAFLMWKIPD
jgi:hypothetical protein